MEGMVEARKWEDDMMVRRLEKCKGARGVPRAFGRGAFAGSAASPLFGASLDCGWLGKGC